MSPQLSLVLYVHATREQRRLQWQLQQLQQRLHAIQAQQRPLQIQLGLFAGGNFRGAPSETFMLGFAFNAEEHARQARMKRKMELDLARAHSSMQNMRAAIAATQQQILAWQATAAEAEAARVEAMRQFMESTEQQHEGNENGQ